MRPNFPLILAAGWVLAACGGGSGTGTANFGTASGGADAAIEPDHADVAVEPGHSDIAVELGDARVPDSSVRLDDARAPHDARAPDAAVPSACAGASVIDFATLAHDVGDGSQVAMLHVGDGDNFRASCGGAGASDVAVRFVAPSGGDWSFTLTAGAVAARQFPLLSLRTDCGDPSSELTCASALSGPVVATATLAASGTVFIVADGLANGPDSQLVVSPPTRAPWRAATPRAPPPARRVHSAPTAMVSVSPRAWR